MPKYLIQASYTLDGVSGVQSQGGSSRRDDETSVLLTPEEIDTAAKRSVDYRPPGG
jgi:hypothetical protein